MTLSSAVDFDVAPPVPLPRPGPPWRVRPAGGAGTAGATYVVAVSGEVTDSADGADGEAVRLAVSRAVHGRWRRTFPVGSRDIIIEATLAEDRQRAAAAVRAVALSLAELDPACRRIIAPCPIGDLGLMATLEDADFAFATETDTEEGTYGLLLFPVRGFADVPG